MKEFYIADNDGVIYADNIYSRTRANLLLNDIIESLKEEKTIEEIKKLEIEIMEV